MLEDDDGGREHPHPPNHVPLALRHVGVLDRSGDGLSGTTGGVPLNLRVLAIEVHEIVRNKQSRWLNSLFLDRLLISKNKKTFTHNILFMNSYIIDTGDDGSILISFILLILLSPSIILFNVFVL